MHIPENFSRYLLSFNLLTFHQQITIVPECVKKQAEMNASISKINKFIG